MGNRRALVCLLGRLAWCTAAVLSLGCGEEECALEESKAYRLELVDRYDGTSSFVVKDPYQTSPSCGTLDLLAEGAQLGFQALQPGPECDLFVLLDDDPGSFNSFAARTSAYGHGVSGTYAVTTVTGCLGEWRLKFEFNSMDDVFKTPVPGTLPPFKVLRLFQGAPETCPTELQSCGDEFVAQVHRL